MGSEAMGRAPCNTQIPYADPAIPPARAEQTDMLWVPYRRFHGAGVSA